ncbi:Uncharacterised protein [Mycobacteroides abscessus subsp. abscessus]|uniref:hypothetical protein n=1 Tax=Mycobacteroides abscessus TaxID=36809 RepID=UPI0009260341|nr:hypothetical protein [Mycobacteroides abscessus]SHX97551.1 Uncharacterised protein [Mycobacteroides abscessus subsp. abscessus]SIC78852.1 Uncharacterised protein [Mycobacteroides abscessus subsp. abscessus]SKP26974.1 Uncharacterised protein [Mycobacteroides abscessus subsp. abscessus]
MRKSEAEDGSRGKSDKEPDLRNRIAEFSALAAVLGLLSLGTAAIPLGVQLMFQTPASEWELALLVLLAGLSVAHGCFWAAYRIVVRR